MSHAGAEMALLDLGAAEVEAAAKKLGGATLALACDVTDPASVRRAFEHVAAELGGLDILVSNAGAAWQGRIGEVDDPVLRQRFELNFFPHPSVSHNPIPIMLPAETPLCLLFTL